MNKKLIFHKFIIAIYESNITLIIGDDINDIHTYVNKNIAKIDISDTEGCVFENHTDERFDYYIVFAKNKLSHNLVAHEIYHLGCSIMKTTNISDEEATAWLIGYITGMLYKFMNKKKLPIR